MGLSTRLCTHSALSGGISLGTLSQDPLDGHCCGRELWVLLAFFSFSTHPVCGLVHRALTPAPAALPVCPHPLCASI